MRHPTPPSHARRGDRACSRRSAVAGMAGRNHPTTPRGAIHSTVPPSRRFPPAHHPVERFPCRHPCRHPSPSDKGAASTPSPEDRSILSAASVPPASDSYVSRETGFRGGMQATPIPPLRSGADARVKARLSSTPAPQAALPWGINVARRLGACQSVHARRTSLRHGAPVVPIAAESAVPASGVAHLVSAQPPKRPAFSSGWLLTTDTTNV